MVWQQTPYVLPLVATAAFLFGFAAYLWSVDREGWTSGTSLGGLLLFAGGTWVGVYTLRLSAATLPGKLLWLRVEFVLVLALPVIWLAYVVRYTGRTDWLSWRVFGPLTAIAAGIELLVLTDGVHHLVYREYGLAQVGSVAVFDPVYGPVFAVYLGFTYTLLGSSLLFLATAAAHARGVFRWQIAVLFLFAVVPGVAGILEVSGNSPVRGLNVAALSLAVSTAAVVVSFARFRWMDVMPIARDRTFESMTEAVIVLDAERRIIDLNTAAEEFLPAADGSPVGDPVTEVCPLLTDALEGIDDRGDAAGPDVRSEITVSDGDDRQYLDVRISPIGTSAGERTGYALLLHDITPRKVAEERAGERRQKIEELHRIARELTATRTQEEIFQRAVDGGEAVLDAEVCRLAIEEEGSLVPTVASGDESVDQYEPQPVDRGIAGATFQSGAPIVVDDLADARDVAPGPEPESGPYLTDGAPSTPNPEPAHRSVLSAPVGDIGVVQAFAADPGEFTDDDREVLELLTTHIETAVQRAEVEAELRTERDRLEEFASVVSHDLRNPLNVAQGRIELLAPEAPAEHVDPIDRSLSRMDDIITDILTLAREGEAAGDTDAVDLERCAGDAWASVDTGSAVMECCGNLGTVEADPGQLRRLLENLFRNAVEHGSTGSRTESDDAVEHGSTGNRAGPDDAAERGSTDERPGDGPAARGAADAASGSGPGPGPTGGADGGDGAADPAVRVRVGLLDDRDGFYVADDGPGIPADERESVFEHGYTTQAGGTGLGLAIVERIADAHGWTVAATESDSGGARFEVRTGA